jgi:hypothetical protein
MTMENLMSGVGVPSVETSEACCLRTRGCASMLYAKEAIEKAVLAGIDIIRDNWID